MGYLSSINDLSAAEGFPVVLIGTLQAFGALALIVGVLIVMDKVYKNNHPDVPDFQEQNNKDDSNNTDNNLGENK